MTLTAALGNFLETIRFDDIPEDAISVPSVLSESRSETVPAWNALESKTLAEPALQAVVDEDREDRGRRLLRRVFQRPGVRLPVVLIRIVVVMAALGSGLHIWYLWTSNSRAIDASAGEVTAAVNAALQARRLEPISTVEFSGASRMLGVPKTLDFQESVFERNASGARSSAGLVKGTFHRPTGALEIYFEWRDDRGQEPILKSQLPAVPRP